MSTSPDDEPPSLEEDDHLLTSSRYPMDVLKGGTPRYRDGIQHANTGQSSASFPFDISEGRISHAQEEAFLTARPNSIDSRNGRAKKSAVRILHALCRWAKGPRPPRPFRIKPILPQLQNVPLAFLQRYIPGRQQKVWLFMIFYLLWVCVFLAVLSISVSGCQVPGYRTLVRLSCVSRFW